MKIAPMVGMSLVSVLAVAGCTRVVDGGARPGPGMPPHPLTGQSIKQVFVDGKQLSKLLGQQFKSDPNFPPRFGGPDQLFDIAAKPPECAGVVFQLQKSAYRSADIEEVARENWWSAGSRRPKIISVAESVVALPTAQDADALFAQFSRQWTRCAGTTVTDYSADGQRFSSAAIGKVGTADSVLSATVRTRVVTTVTHARALGVRVNCLVDVDVAYFSDRPDATAVGLAHRMMNKVSDLS